MNRVVTMDLSRHNMLLAGHDRYFAFESGGRVQLVRDRCPHRGGPLSLARLEPDGRRLTCPWHGTRVAVTAVCRTSLPMVRTGDEAVVVLADVPPERPVTRVHRRILANLPPAQPQGQPAGQRRTNGTTARWAAGSSSNDGSITPIGERVTT